MLKYLGANAQEFIVGYVLKYLQVDSSGVDADIYISSDFLIDVPTLAQDAREKGTFIAQLIEYDQYRGLTIFPYKNRVKPIVLLDGGIYTDEYAPTKTVIHELIHALHYINYIVNENYDINQYYMEGLHWEAMMVYTEFYATYLSIQIEFKMMKDCVGYDQMQSFAKGHYTDERREAIKHVANGTFSKYKCAGYLGCLYALSNMVNRNARMDSSILRACPNIELLYNQLSMCDELNVSTNDLEIVQEILSTFGQS